MAAQLFRADEATLHARAVRSYWMRGGAPRSMKMGTTRLRRHCDAAARHARQSANLRCAAGLHDAVPISPTGPVTFDSGSTDQPGNRCGVTASDIAVSLAVN